MVALAVDERARALHVDHCSVWFYLNTSLRRATVRFLATVHWIAPLAIQQFILLHGRSLSIFLV